MLEIFDKIKILSPVSFEIFGEKHKFAEFCLFVEIFRIKSDDGCTSRGVHIVPALLHRLLRALGNEQEKKDES